MILEEIISLTNNLSKEQIESVEQLRRFESNVIKWQPVVREIVSFSRNTEDYEVYRLTLWLV